MYTNKKKKQNDSDTFENHWKQTSRSTGKAQLIAKQIQI